MDDGGFLDFENEFFGQDTEQSQADFNDWADAFLSTAEGDDGGVSTSSASLLPDTDPLAPSSLSNQSHMGLGVAPGLPSSSANISSLGGVQIMPSGNTIFQTGQIIQTNVQSASSQHINMQSFGQLQQGGGNQLVQGPNGQIILKTIGSGGQIFLQPANNISSLQPSASQGQQVQHLQGQQVINKLLPSNQTVLPCSSPQVSRAITPGSGVNSPIVSRSVTPNQTISSMSPLTVVSSKGQGQVVNNLQTGGQNANMLQFVGNSQSPQILPRNLPFQMQGSGQLLQPQQALLANNQGQSGLIQGQGQQALLSGQGQNIVNTQNTVIQFPKVVNLNVHHVAPNLQGAVGTLFTTPDGKNILIPSHQLQQGQINIQNLSPMAIQQPLSMGQSSNQTVYNNSVPLIGNFGNVIRLAPQSQTPSGQDSSKGQTTHVLGLNADGQQMIIQKTMASAQPQQNLIFRTISPNIVQLQPQALQNLVSNQQTLLTSASSNSLQTGQQQFLMANQQAGMALQRVTMPSSSQSQQQVKIIQPNNPQSNMAMNMNLNPSVPSLQTLYVVSSDSSPAISTSAPVYSHTSQSSTSSVMSVHSQPNTSSVVLPNTVQAMLQQQQPSQHQQQIQNLFGIQKPSQSHQYLQVPIHSMSSPAITTQSSATNTQTTSSVAQSKMATVQNIFQQTTNTTQMQQIVAGQQIQQGAIKMTQETQQQLKEMIAGQSSVAGVQKNFQQRQVCMTLGSDGNAQKQIFLGTTLTQQMNTTNVIIKQEPQAHIPTPVQNLLNVDLSQRTQSPSLGHVTIKSEPQTSACSTPLSGQVGAVKIKQEVSSTTCHEPPTHVPMSQPNTHPVDPNATTVSQIKIGNQTLTLNLTPQKKAELLKYLADLTPEQQQQQLMHFFQEQRKNRHQAQVEAQMKRQNQQKPPVIAPASTPNTGLPTTVLQTTASDVPQSQGTPVLISPKKNVKIHVPFADIPKTQLIHQQLSKDQDNALRPDTKTPFQSKRDLYRRLLRYHVFQHKHPPQSVIDEDETKFESMAEDLIQKKDKMFDRFRSFLLKESMMKYRPCEMFMIQRLLNEDLTETIKAEKSLLKENPEAFTPLCLDHTLAKKETEEESMDDSGESEENMLFDGEGENGHPMTPKVKIVIRNNGQNFSSSLTENKAEDVEFSCDGLDTAQNSEQTALRSSGSERSSKIDIKAEVGSESMQRDYDQMCGITQEMRPEFDNDGHYWDKSMETPFQNYVDLCDDVGAGSSAVSMGSRSEPMEDDLKSLGDSRVGKHSLGDERPYSIGNHGDMSSWVNHNSHLHGSGYDGLSNHTIRTSNANAVDSATSGESRVHSKGIANNSSSAFDGGLFNSAMDDDSKDSDFAKLESDCFHPFFPSDKSFSHSELFNSALDKRLSKDQTSSNRVPSAMDKEDEDESLLNDSSSYTQQLSVTQYEPISSPEMDDSFSISGHKLDSSYGISLRDQSLTPIPSTSKVTVPMSSIMTSSSSSASSRNPTATYSLSQMSQKSNISMEMAEDEGTPTTLYSDESDKDADPEDELHKAQMQNAIESIISLNQDSSPYPVSQTSDYLGPPSYHTSEGATSREVSSQEVSADEGEDGDAAADISDDLDAAVRSIL